MPTSTTVSIVFELLGAAVAMSLIKIGANGGSFVETDKDWIEFYKKKGLINTSFKCKGGKKPFLIKVEPYRIKSESVSYKIYVKNLQ